MTCHPAARNPRLAALVAVLLGLLSVLLALSATPLTALVLSGVLWGSLASYFLPTRYVVEDGCLVVSLGPLAQRYPWSRFRRLVRDRNGLLLSPFRRAHPLESFRGVFLPVDPTTASHLAPLIEARL